MNATPSTFAAWALVAASGAFEILFSVQMKASDGFRHLVPSALAIVSGLLSIWLMTLSLRTLPLGAAYAVWAGLGTVGTAIAAVILYAEQFTVLKVAFMACVVVGIVGLQWLSSE
jgi:quaternary ammonium compound-resistance protein SugE